MPTDMALLIPLLSEVYSVVTPLLHHPLNPRLLVKHEGAGPLISHKHRSSHYLLARELLHRDELMAGVVVGSSGSWAMGWAHACQLLGIACHCVAVEALPNAVRTSLSIKGATCEIVGSHAERVARAMQLQNEGWYWPNQFDNPAVITAFEHTLGYQLVKQLEELHERPTYLIGPVGTGGLLAGTARALRATGHKITVVGADPSSSIAHEGARSFKIPSLHPRGAGHDDTVYETLKTASRDIDLTVTASSFSAAEHMWRFSRTSVTSCGLSGGLALAAAFQQVVPFMEEGEKALVLLPDRGDAYVKEFAIAAQLFGNSQERNVK